MEAENIEIKEKNPNQDQTIFTFKMGVGAIIMLAFMSTVGLMACLHLFTPFFCLTYAGSDIYVFMAIYVVAMVLFVYFYVNDKFLMITMVYAVLTPFTALLIINFVAVYSAGKYCSKWSINEVFEFLKTNVVKIYYGMAGTREIKMD